MKITDLSELEFLHGSFTLIFVFISFVIGFLFLTKYISTKRIEHITLGLVWIFLASGWWGAAFSFLSILFFNEPLNEFAFVFLGNVFVPLAIILWIYSISHIMYPKKEKIIFSIFLVICIPYEISIIILLSIDSSLIGKKVTTFNYIPSPYVMLFQIFSVLTAFITGLIFSIKSMKMKDKKVRLRAKILLIAFLSFTIGAFLDAILPLSEIPLVIIRVILITSSIDYYFGWFLPKKLENVLVNE